MKAKKTILFVEDDFPTIDVYKTAMVAAGFSVETITIGSEAIEKLNKIEEKKTKKPDLILLDFLLPDINGIEVLRAIKTNEKTKDIPVFVLTNYASKALKKEGLALGADKYLVKTDYPPTKLVGVIKKSFKG
ncbi:MAG TPA: response regulator [Candidatus Parcubacteria bacterium]|nr:response regulator [Candidatus Parcubacteria bacterium]